LSQNLAQRRRRPLGTTNTNRALRPPHERLGPKISGGTPRSVLQLFLQLILCIPRLGIAFKLDQPGSKICLYFRRYLNGLRRGGNTVQINVSYRQICMKWMPLFVNFISEFNPMRSKADGTDEE